MSAVYRYIDRITGEVVYVGIVGTHGREGGLEGVLLRDEEHFSIITDPIFVSDYGPNDLSLEYCDGLTETDARVIETLSIAFFKPRLNKSQKRDGGTILYHDLKVDFTPVQERRAIEKRHKAHGRRSRGKSKAIALTDEEFRCICAYFDEHYSPTRERDWLIIILLSNIGMRLSDVCNLDLCDYDGESLRIKRLGRSVSCDNDTKDALDSYIPVRVIPHGSDANALIISGQHNRISPKTIQHVVRSVSDVCGLSHLSVASLRELARTRFETDLMRRRGKNLLE